MSRNCDQIPFLTNVKYLRMIGPEFQLFHYTSIHWPINMSSNQCWSPSFSSNHHLLQALHEQKQSFQWSWRNGISSSRSANTRRFVFEVANSPSLESQLTIPTKIGLEDGQSQVWIELKIELTVRFIFNFTPQLIVIYGRIILVAGAERTLAPAYFVRLSTCTDLGSHIAQIGYLVLFLPSWTAPGLLVL